MNLSRRLEVTGSDSHGIGKPYLINGSQIQYTFSTSSVQPPTTPCVAMAYIFHDSVNYFEFIRTGKVNQANATCLPSASTVSIMVSAEDEDQYLFIGVKSFVQATIDYTVIGGTLIYNVILSPPTMCSLSLLSPECSISLAYLPSGQNICILANLQFTSDSFTILDIFSLSHRHATQTETMWTVLGAVAIPFSMVAIFGFVSLIYGCVVH